jgi:hypothetical protein
MSVFENMFSFERLLRVVIAAVALGGSMRLAKVLLQRAGILVSQKEGLVFMAAVFLVLQLTNAIADLPMAFMFITVFVVAFIAGKFANSKIDKR